MNLAIATTMWELEHAVYLLVCKMGTQHLPPSIQSPSAFSLGAPHSQLGLCLVFSASFSSMPIH